MFPGYANEKHYVENLQMGTMLYVMDELWRLSQIIKSRKYKPGSTNEKTSLKR